MVYTCLTIYLGVLSVGDVRKKEVPVKLLLVGLLGSLVYGIWMHRGMGMLLGSVPGILLILMGFLTREKVGYGDGIMVLIMGLLLDWPESVLIYMLAQFGVLFFAVTLLWLKKVPRELKIPFAPFLTAAVIIYRFGGLLL